MSIPERQQWKRAIWILALACVIQFVDHKYLNYACFFMMGMFASAMLRRTPWSRRVLKEIGDE